MSYPDFDQTIESDEALLDDVMFDRSSNGNLRGRSMWSTPRRSFNVAHQLSRSDADAILSHYANNRDMAFDFTWQGDSNTYSCMYAGPPTLTPLEGLWWNVNVKLEQV